MCNHHSVKNNRFQYYRNTTVYRGLKVNRCWVLSYFFFGTTHYICNELNYWEARQEFCCYLYTVNIPFN